MFAEGEEGLHRRALLIGVEVGAASAAAILNARIPIANLRARSRPLTGATFARRYRHETARWMSGH